MPDAHGNSRSMPIRNSTPPNPCRAARSFRSRERSEEMICSVESTFQILTARHYLGPTRNAFFGWRDEFGVMVFANPRSRRLPQDRWLELVRWCLLGDENGGSRQWAAFTCWAKRNAPKITTIVSYSDPSRGHTGALYRACNWLWAPTWHRLR